MITHVLKEEIEHGGLVELGFDEVWYDYEAGYYDGSGALLARKDDKFVLFDIGHCSCYGPEDTIDLNEKKWEDFEALWSRLSELNRECCKTVFEAARKS